MTLPLGKLIGVFGRCRLIQTSNNPKRTITVATAPIKPPMIAPILLLPPANNTHTGGLVPNHSK